MELFFGSSIERCQLVRVVTEMLIEIRLRWNAIDVVALKGLDGELSQCKSSKREDLLWGAIKEVVGGAAMYQARFSGYRMKKVAVTNQQFNGRTIEQAIASQVELVTRTQLEELL